MATWAFTTWPCGGGVRPPNPPTTETSPPPSLILSAPSTPPQPTEQAGDKGCMSQGRGRWKGHGTVLSSPHGHGACILRSPSAESSVVPEPLHQGLLGH